MNKTVLIVFILFFAFHTKGFCQHSKDNYKLKSDTITKDSVEYELIVLDPGFEVWLITQPKKEFYSIEYYQLKNRLYVSEWNQRYLNAANNGLYDSYINYEPGIDYGLDLNYNLYYYFKYFEDRNHLKLLNSER